VHYSRRTRIRNLPVSPRPPIQSSERPYGPTRRERRRGMLKIKQINDKSVSQMLEVETAYLRRAHVTQPHGNASICCWEVHGARRQRDRIKIAPINVSPMHNSETAYLGCDPITQPHGDDPQCSYGVIGPKCRCG